MADLHPHQLHALAAIGSVAAARAELLAAVATERGLIVREARTVAAAVEVQGWRPVIGRGVGGHGDPTARAALGMAVLSVPEPGRLGRLALATEGTLRWLADRLITDRGEGDIARLRLVLPSLRPYLAERLTLWLGDVDGQIRTALQLDPLEHLVPGVACPACGVRQLYALTSSYRPSVVCRAGCRCAGDGCTCLMPIRPAGLSHIWGPGSVLSLRAMKVLVG